VPGLRPIQDDPVGVRPRLKAGKPGFEPLWAESQMADRKSLVISV